MSERINQLVNNNREWAAPFEIDNPLTLRQLAQQQASEYHWVDCSDSSVVANTIVDLQLGKDLQLRNVASRVNHSDPNVCFYLNI